MFIFERERDRQRERERERERGRERREIQNPKQAPGSELSNARLEPTDCEIMT